MVGQQLWFFDKFRGAKKKTRREGGEKIKIANFYFFTSLSISILGERKIFSKFFFPLKFIFCAFSKGFVKEL